MHLLLSILYRKDKGVRIECQWESGNGCDHRGALRRICGTSACGGIRVTLPARIPSIVRSAPTVSESTMRIINFVSPSGTQRKPGGAQDVASAGETKRGHREY